MNDELLKRIRREISELERKLSALREAESLLTSALRPTAVEKRANPAKIVEGSIKDEVLKLLASRPDGLKAIDILHALRETSHPGLMRTSLSPQLSRLKREGRLSYREKLWLLARSIEEEPM